MHFTLGDYVLDIAQNAVEAGAGEVEIGFREDPEGFRVSVADDGIGMTDEELGRALDPFYTDGTKHAARRVGLGLPFLAQAVALAGGDWKIDSKKGQGTRVRFFFPAASFDSPPPGDIPTLFLVLLCLPGEHEMRISRDGPRGAYRLVRSELSEALGGLELGSSLALLKDYLASQEEIE
ncbi:MAG: sensor histidine kinase [Spirochaetaceae bacterium]|nr:sensor histidine kinase [Spirochaetaceae bacterium]